MSFRKPWRKILYEDQGYADNFTDKTFLRDLKKNINIKEISIKEAAFGALIFLQQLCTVIIFCLFYIYLYNEWIDPSTMLNYTSIISLLGFVIYYLKNRNVMIRQNIRTLIIYLLFGRLFSPVLHTLTDTISTDSIYTMAFLMLLVHLIFFDYGVDVAIISNSLSLSAAMFASICLASRLASPHHAFVLLTIAIKCFLLFPTLRKSLVNQFVPLTITLILIISLVLYSISSTSFISFISLLLFINVFCPILFVRYQKYKENIYGPWDEAVIRNAININDLIY